MTTHPDVLIIGGGVIGLTTAYFLARAGVRVDLVDQGDIGQEASWAGAGILPPGSATARSPYDRLRARSVALFPSLSAELRERTGLDNGYVRCGGLEFLGEDEAAAAEEWRGDGIAFEVLDGPALHRLEPALSPALVRGFYIPEMAQVRNPRHLKALRAACESYGVVLRPGCPVYAFERRNERISAVRSAVGTHGAGRFLLAAGAWTDTLLDPFGWRLLVRPVRGQIALVNTGAPLVRKVLMRGKRYLVPRPDGRILIGSTEEDAGFDKRPTAGAVSDLLALGCELVPALASAPLERCWAGLRPGTADGLPYLGGVPGWNNLYVAAGHFRSGIQLSPGTAQVMKELLLSEPVSLPLEAFSLTRAPKPGFATLSPSVPD
jgi:glycine oxidase